MGAFDPRAELERAEAARDQFVRSVGYPRGYVAMSALGAGLLVAGNGASADPSAPTGLRIALWIAFGLGFVLVIAGLLHFQQSNRVRVHGLRFARRWSVAYVALFIAITCGQVAAGPWWAGLIGAPIVAAFTALYLRYWLRDYQRIA